jgi:hypothetical protein
LPVLGDVVDGDVIEIHENAVEGVHWQAVPFVVTVNELPVLAPNGTDALVGLSVYVQAACVALNVCPAMVIVPSRVVGPVLPANVQPTVPLPVPGVPEVTVIHPALLTAVHEQFDVTAIETPAVGVRPPTGTAGSLVGRIELPHPSCVTVKMFPWTEMLADRWTPEPPPELSPTSNVIVPELDTIPDGAVIDNHGWLDEADHWQVAALVVRLTVCPAAPVTGMFGNGEPNV